MLLLDTGLRASGIFSFKISNVDLTNTRLLIPHLFFHVSECCTCYSFKLC
jgi:hypothetical protein